MYCKVLNFYHIFATSNTQKMNIENTKAQMRKGVLEFCILSLLSAREAYANDLIQTMKESKLLVVEGTIYPLLTRLKNDGLLTYRWVESTGGPPRKYYSATPEGIFILEGLRQTWNELVLAVSNATTANPNKEEQMDNPQNI